MTPRSKAPAGSGKSNHPPAPPGALGPAGDAHAPGRPRPRSRAWRLTLLCSLLAATVVAAYWRTLPVPLLFDDIAAIADNPTIRHLRDLGAVLSPPSTFIEASGVSSRPLINLSFAINYALGGLDPWGYHAANLAIHLLATLVLFGVLEGTFARRGADGGGRPLNSPTSAAFCAALLWSVHPLLTESVTCVIQRTESLMGLCYLMTLYGFIRYSGSTARRGTWAAFAALCCLLGMAAKETMVTAPLVVLLFDRTFVSGSFRESWRRHGRMHLALAATWILLAFLVIRAGPGSRGIAAGPSLGSDSWRYLLTQCRAIVLYLKLSVWPHPLVVDYGLGTVSGPAEVWPQAIVVLALLACTARAVLSRPALGFLGAWFFLILAPSSSVVPLVAQTIAEHRMYLPLASVTVLGALAADRFAGRASVPLCLAGAAVLFLATVERNGVYRNVVGLWRQTVADCPDNPRARNNLGVALMGVPGGRDEAIAQYEAALRLVPDFAPAHNNLGLALVGVPGRLGDAIFHFQEAIRLVPGFAAAHYSLGKALVDIPGRTDEAIGHYREAIRLIPDFAEVHDSLGNALARMPGKLDEAISHYEEAVRLKPDFADAHDNLAIALAGVPGRMDEAIAHYREAIRLRPDFAEAHNNLGDALARLPGRLNEAIAQYREALRLNPDFAEAHFNLAVAYLKSGCCRDEAESQLAAGLRLHPGDREARRILDSLEAAH